MKKIWALAIVGIATLTSCYKDYTCNCTSRDKSGNITGTSYTTIGSASKKNAEDKCKESDRLVDGITTRCFLEE